MFDLKKNNYKILRNRCSVIKNGRNIGLPVDNYKLLHVPGSVVGEFFNIVINRKISTKRKQ